jgi:hypothetical protein
MDSAQMMGGIYAWVDLTGFRAEDDDANRAYSGRGLQIGADMAGHAGHGGGPVALASRTSNATVGAVGPGRRPSLPAALHGLSLRGVVGRGERCFMAGAITPRPPAGAPATGETRLAAITFNGGYDMALIRASR